jgi:3',5'-cyclic AMP phosphodiesterase CpdA
MFSLAHISDIHLSPLPPVTYLDLMSKRIIGYVNWKLNRAKTHGQNTLSLLVADIKAHKPDHVVVTGDLVNLALGAEFETTRQWLEALGHSDDVSVVPGNHDAYVPAALVKACKAWGNYMPVTNTNAATIKAIEDGFPYLRRAGPLAIIGVSSAIASAPFLAIGRFRQSQANRLHSILMETAKEGLFRVILIHHPPFRYDGDAAKRLYGIRLFQRTIQQAGAELVLHGHTHRASFQQIRGMDKPVPVIGVPSAAQLPEAFLSLMAHQTVKNNATGQEAGPVQFQNFEETINRPGGHKPAGRWNEFKISGTPDRWTCQWIERGIQPDRSIMQLSSRPIWSNGEATFA